MSDSDLIVLKIGGSVAGEDAAALDSVASLHDAGHSLVVVHGGGPLVGEWATQLGYETKFVKGLRVTDEKTRDVALAVLGGLANGRVVATLIARGVPAVGLTGIDGGMLRAEREDAELGFVGRVTLVDSALLEELIDAGRVPIVAPAALDRTSGEVLNVNGDAAAGAIAASLSARLLVFVTDVPGVRGKDGRVLPTLDPRPREGARRRRHDRGRDAAEGRGMPDRGERGLPRRDRRGAHRRRGRAAPRRGTGRDRLRGGGMRDALARKHHRQQALLRVVRSQKLATQQDLVRALKAAGFPATQATVSRDIVELGLVKVARDGAHAYAAPTAVASGGGTDRLRRFCEDYPVDGDLAGNIVVLRSSPRHRERARRRARRIGLRRGRRHARRRRHGVRRGRGTERTPARCSRV